MRDLSHCLVLCLHDQRQRAQSLAVVGVRGKLNEIERHSLILPDIPPQANHGNHKIPIVKPVDPVRLPLVPDPSLGRVMAQRPDHRVEQPVGLTGDPFSGEGELMVDPLGGEDCLIAHPAFDACASPVRGDQTHRHTYESLGQRPAEEITAGAALTRLMVGKSHSPPQVSAGSSAGTRGTWKNLIKEASVGTSIRYSG